MVLGQRTAAASAEEAQLALALALSLSLCDAERRSGDDAAGTVDIAARPASPPRERLSSDPLSYEALVQLEDVRSVAPPAEVDALPCAPFSASSHGGDDARCGICLDLYAPDEALLLLPCGHAMHAACGRDYLLRWSKRCPEAFCRRSVRPCDAHD